MPAETEYPVDLLEFESADESARATTHGDEELEELHEAAQLLEVTNESEWEQFVGRLLAQAARAGGRPINPAVLVSLRRALRRTAGRALPPGGTDPYSDRADVGQRLAAAAESMFGLELEGLSPEDQEFELARRFVRLARTAGRRVGHFARVLPPHTAARRALFLSARRHAPGLVRRGTRLVVQLADADDPEPAADTCTCGGTCAHCRSRAGGGRWVRVRDRIILHDV